MANIATLSQKAAADNFVAIICECVESVGVRGDFETAEEMLWPFKTIIDRVLGRQGVII